MATRESSIPDWKAGEDDGLSHEGHSRNQKNVPEARAHENRWKPRARALGPYSKFASPGTGRKKHSSPVLPPRSGARLSFTPFPVLTHWASI